MPAVTTPPPPPFPSGLADDDAVKLLLVSYRSAVGHHLGKRCMLYASGPPKKPEDRAKLARAAAAMAEHQIAACPWIAWRCSQWAQSSIAAKRPTPPISFVFDPAKIVKLRGQYRNEVRPLTWGSESYCRRHLELLVLWRRAHRAMTTAIRDGATLAAAESAASEILPAGLYDELVAAAREDSSRANLRIRQAAKRGDWLW